MDDKQPTSIPLPDGSDVVAESDVKVGDLRFSLLNYLLVVDRYMPRLGKVGLDTPLLLRVECPIMDVRAAESFLVTSPRGRFVLVPNRGKPELNTACIPCSLTQEDDLLVRLIHFLAESSLERDWGNYADIKGFGPQNVDAALAFLNTYELPPSSIFMGVEAFKKMRKAIQPAKGQKVPYLKDLLFKSDLLGTYKDVPVFLLPKSLASYCMVNAPPSCVGNMTRIGDHIALIMHNLIRSFALYKVL